MPLRDVAGVLTDVAAGLAVAHEAGIIHRDLKPANIILTRNGPAKILDFGLAKVMAIDQATMTQMTGAGTTVGTVAYMAPEQAQGEGVDQRADVWALGIMLYEMLTGRVPFKADNAAATLLAIITKTPQPLKELRPDVPPEIERIVGRALQRDRAARTITAAEIAHEVGAYRMRVSSGEHAPVSAPSLWAGLKHQRVAIPVALALVALVSAAAWAWQRNARIRWAHYDAVPEVMRLADQEQFATALEVAREAEKYRRGDPALARALEIVSRPATIDTNPQGAEVSYKGYAADDAAPWVHLGTSPITPWHVPDQGCAHSPWGPAFEDRESWTGDRCRRHGALRRCHVLVRARRASRDSGGNGQGLDQRGAIRRVHARVQRST
jgi:hypothetical protein